MAVSREDFAGKHDGVGIGRHFLGLGNHFDSGQARHVEVDNEAVVRVFLQRRDGRKTIWTDGHFVTHARQLQAHQPLE